MAPLPKIPIHPNKYQINFNSLPTLPNKKHLSHHKQLFIGVRPHELRAPFFIHEECIRLKTLFLQLAYPEHLIQSMISNSITSKQTPAPPRESTPDLQSVRIIVLPFKEQKSADSVRKQLKDLGNLLNIDLCPVFISRKGGEDLKHQEINPALINEQSVVYKFKSGWCDASYVSYTRRHLCQRIDEHKRSGSIFNHTQSQHPSRTITSNMFHILKKCSGKFDCLLYEMFLIREHKPCLNIQRTR